MVKMPFDEQRVIDLIASGEPGGALGPLDGFSKRRRIEWIVERSFDEEETSSSPTLHRRFNLAVSIAAAAAAVIAVFVGHALLQKEPGLSPIYPPALAQTMSEPLLRTPKLNETGTLVTADATNQDLIGPGVHLLFESNTTLWVMKTEKEISLYLERGTVWLDVDPDEKPTNVTVKVQTLRGMVTVMGTVFGVRETSRFTDTFVLKGTVCVIDRSQTTVWVSSGHRLRIGERMARSMNPEEIQVAWRHLRDHGVAINRVPGAPFQQTSPRQFIQERSPDVSSITAQKLLKRARRQRDRGDYRAANRSLARLVREFSTSEEAPVALVAKGRLALDQLASPEMALRHFNAYLASPRHRDLRAEALLGKATAERRLGNTKDACNTLKDFVHQYQRGLLANRARRELASCQSN
jgi:hypothetical protein